MFTLKPKHLASAPVSGNCMEAQMMTVDSISFAHDWQLGQKPDTTSSEVPAVAFMVVKGWPEAWLSQRPDEHNIT